MSKQREIFLTLFSGMWICQTTSYFSSGKSQVYLNVTAPYLIAISFSCSSSLAGIAPNDFFKVMRLGTLLRLCIHSTTFNLIAQLAIVGIVSSLPGPVLRRSTIYEHSSLTSFSCPFSSSRSSMTKSHISSSLSPVVRYYEISASSFSLISSSIGAPGLSSNSKLSPSHKVKLSRRELFLRSCGA